MQSPGAYAIVNAMKNNPESTLIEIELTVRKPKHLLTHPHVLLILLTLIVFGFQDITVNNDFIELCKEVQHLRPKMKISHGGAGGAVSKPKPRPTPMKILKNYIEDNKMRLLDLFNTLDKDKSMNITVEEFADGLKVSSMDKTLLLFKVFPSLVNPTSLNLDQHDHVKTLPNQQFNFLVSLNRKQELT